MEIQQDEQLDENQNDQDIPLGPTPEQIETEKRARRMGWVPKEEFRGDPDRHIPADKFLERGEQELPILRERYRQLETKIDGMEQTFKEFKEYHKKSVDSAYERASRDYETEIRSLKRQLRDAASSGDTNTYDRLDAQLDNLEKNRPEKPIIENQQSPNGPRDPIVEAWIDDNRWFNTDMEARNYALSMEQYIANTRGLKGRQLYDAVADEVKLRFPDRFQNPNRNNPASVDSGDTPPLPKKKTGHTFDDLPEDAKTACRNYVKQGLMTKEQYLEEYIWEE